MRLIRLEFENINSLAGHWMIDFTDEAFARSGMFVITGPTGSGKTSILDAVSLALYGITPRTRNLSSSDEACPVITKNRGAASASVVFEERGRWYMSAWSRHFSKGGKIQQARVRLVELAGPQADAPVVSTIAEQIREWNAAVKTLTGMSFETFSRTMLLAQGAFAGFLKAAPKDRAALLEQITGADVYSLVSQKIFDKTQQAKAARDECEAALRELRVLPDAERRQLEASLSESESACVDAAKRRTEAEASLRFWDAFDAARQRMSAARKDADIIAAQEPAMAALSNSLRRAEAARQPVLHAGVLQKEQAEWNRLQAELRETQSLESRRRKDADEQKALEAAAVAREAKAVECEMRFRPLAQAMRQADLCIRNAEAEVRTALDRQKLWRIKAEAAKARESKAQSVCDEAASAFERALQADARHASDLELEARLPLLRRELERFAAAVNGVDQAREALEAASRSEQTALDASRRANAEYLASENAWTAAKAAEESARREHESACAGVGLEGALLRMRRLAERAADARQALVLLEGIEEAREAVRAGRASGNAELCAWASRSGRRLRERFLQIASVWPEIVDTMTAEDAERMKAEADAVGVWSRKVDDAEKALRAARKERESQALAFEKVRLERDKQFGELALARQAKISAQEALVRSSELLEGTKAALEGLPSECGIDEAREAVRSLEARLDAARRAREALQRAKEHKQLSESALAASQAACAECRAPLESAQADCSSAKAALEKLRISRQDKWGNVLPEAEEKRLTAEVLAARTERDAQIMRTRDAERLSTEAAERAKRLNAEISRLRLSCEQSEADLDRMLAQKGFSSLQEALNAAMDEQTFAAASSKLRRHEDSKLRSSEECRRAEEALAEIESRRTAASREQAQAELLAAKSEEAQALRTMGAVKERLAQDGVSRERSEALQRALARNEKLWSEWSQLCALIGSRNGQSFSREAQKLTFRVLLRHANEVLRGMSSRYRLKAGGAEGMEVLVIDRDMAGIERTSANLSGGESFFVSLALALALSEVSTGGMRVDTLFLDEGFGTLDSASLERVLNALEVLQQRSRKLIGLISHVPAVRERLSARIAVRPAGRTGLSLLEGPGLMRLD